MNIASYESSLQSINSCYCIGPQNGQPLCPCMMKGLIVRNGRYIRPEEDLGPVEQDSKCWFKEAIVNE